MLMQRCLFLLDAWESVSWSGTTEEPAWLRAASILLSEVTAPELAEALAVRRAMALARDEGFGHIILATDCLSVV